MTYNAHYLSKSLLLIAGMMSEHRNTHTHTSTRERERERERRRESFSSRG